MDKMNISAWERGIRAEDVNFIVIFVDLTVFILIILSVTYVWTIL